MSTTEESNARHAEYRARERRNNIAMMAKRMMVLRIGHVVGLANVSNEPNVYRLMSRQALAAAEAFYQELDTFDATHPTTGHGE